MVQWKQCTVNNFTGKEPNGMNGQKMMSVLVHAM